ncbi:hypothetical protein SAMN05216526_0490 [Ectothiorhodosinus mongolicus]|uniref:Aminoglycoside phosphotransferase domain-containing protein n=1 Tax=Ectothiorhodosinus mongolicus TaxID=233100 RepID=A0A1R3VSJ8_9GAMM|nr:bifunctional aminoglycoside phosphotransferase/ATP-binding protein [Ectothiorhodosinus mongolicus]SIT66135.1 hypothetical protein SAMN05216526_0490 [Ectothiorhodosinus mongolicus]
MHAHQTLITALHNPDCYPHPVASVEKVETHISTVLLAGDFAYKIKKPLNLGFLDFTTLEQRKTCCDEELRLNSRLAPDIYLDVIAITGSPNAPQFNGSGEAFEYAVRMRRFDTQQTLDRLQAASGIDLALMDAIADGMAAFHETAAKSHPELPHGHPTQVMQPMRDNFTQTAPLLRDPQRLEQLERLRVWTEATYAELEPVLAARQAAGFVRECHGDLHLGNIALIAGQPVPFDGIEFNADMRWIDVISEMGFLTMDLQARGMPQHAWRVLNAWLSRSGDYQGLVLLNFYQVYRAMVRAKVTGIRLSQDDLDPQTRATLEGQVYAYLDLAERFTEPRQPALLIMHGLSGSGKTHISQQLLQELGLIRLRSDTERKRLAGVPAEQSAASEPGTGLYSESQNARTYAQLEQLTDSVLDAGFDVIVDATFSRFADRQRFFQLAQGKAYGFGILECQASVETLRARIEKRQAEGHDASDADLRVLEKQLQNATPFQADEPILIIDSQQPLDLEAITQLMGGKQR